MNKKILLNLLVIIVMLLSIFTVAASAQPKSELAGPAAQERAPVPDKPGKPLGLLPVAQQAVDPPPPPQTSAVETMAANPPADQAAFSPKAALHFWNFEADNGGFAGSLDWEWGAYTWTGGTCDSANYPPPAAHSGVGMWGTVLNSCYNNLGNNTGYSTCVNGNPTDDSILTFTVDLTGITAPVELSWWEWYDLFMDWDWAQVYANGDVVFQHCGGGFVAPTEWARQAVDLTPYAGGPVTIEFHMMASTVVNHAGWYIDDVMVRATLDAWKEAPPFAEIGDIISYTIVISTPTLVDGMIMSDTLPAGVEYAGNLSWTHGLAWYSPTVNTVYWVYHALKASDTPAAQRLTVYDPAAVAERVDDAQASAQPAPQGLAQMWAYPAAVLWDNGPLVTHPGGGYNGADASVLQTALGLNTYGIGNQFLNGHRMADDFEITPLLGWQIDHITFFAYQTGVYSDPPTSTITGLYYQIWDGPPDSPSSTVVFGDLTTNRLLSTTWSNIYRVTDTAITNTQRPIMDNVAGAGVTLLPGDYWLDWTTDGLLTSGPWAPPISILGQITTGNALQYTTAWAAARDTGTNTQQGMPFIIEGTLAEPARVEITFDVTVTSACGEVIVNEGVVRLGSGFQPFTATTTVVGHPNIAVEPSALWAEVCPDATEPMTFTICNWGDCLLHWEIYETMPALALASSPFMPIKVTDHGSNPALSIISPPVKPMAVPPADSLLYDVLWDQPISVITQSAWVNQEFGDFSSYSSFLADDFVNTEPWLIQSIFVPGDGWSGFSTLMNATALTWQIYADSVITPGIPAGDPSGGGSPPVWTLTLPPNNPQVVITAGTPGGLPSNVQLNLAMPGVLPPGTWWLVFYPTMEYGSFGQYGRQPADTNNGYTGQFINPGGGFGYGTAWQDWNVLGSVGHDIAFRLEGTVAPIADVPWLSESPISGTLPVSDCQTVEATFDASGLLPGDYFANLLIVNNDPDTPGLTVPVTLTVAEAVSSSGFSWTPITPTVGAVVTFTASATGAAPIVYTWDFDGVIKTGALVTHSFASSDAYTVIMTASNDCGLQVVTHAVTVEPAQPTHKYIYLPIILKNS